MGKKKVLTAEEKGKIDAFHSEGFAMRYIAKKIGRSDHVIRNYIKNSASYGTNYKGRTKTALTPQDKRKLIRIASNSAASTSKIKEKAGIVASLSTVRRAILSADHLKLKKLKKKPPLNAVRKEKRLEFARLHMTWDTELGRVLNWRNVVFSDEKKFNLDGPDGYNYYFHDVRKEEQFLTRHHSRQGGVMVWGAISYYGAFDLVFVSNKMTGLSYKALLESAFPAMKELFGPIPWIFQQDNAPIHNARVIKTFLAAENVELLSWPPYSPDLNIIENVWGWLTRQIYEGGRQYETCEELIVAIKEAWKKISFKYLEKLYDSLKNIIFDVILTHGGSTKY